MSHYGNLSRQYSNPEEYVVEYQPGADQQQEKSDKIKRERERRDRAKQKNKRKTQLIEEWEKKGD